MKVKGFSLIEVMIGCFILAFGLLGLAGVKSTAVKSVVEVQQRTLASSLVADISERMQLNRVWLQSTGNNYAISSLFKTDLSTPSCIKAGGVFDNCTGKDIKNNDLKEWKNKFLGVGAGTNSGLIAADACIELDGSGRSVVVISWSSTISSTDGADSDHASQSYKCGVASNTRRQLRATIYTAKSS